MRSHVLVLTLVLAAACGTTSGAARGPNATTTAAAGATSPTASPPLALPTKPTPCPFDHDTTGIGVTGAVLWNGTPIGGVKVEAFQPGAPGRGPAEATATTGTDGTYRLTGLRARVIWHVAVMEQPGFLPNGGSGVELCEKRDVALGPLVALRTIEGLSLERGVTVPAGPQTLSWLRLAGADEYCVSVTTPGDPTTFKRWTPEQCSDAPPFPRGARVLDPRYVTPDLPAGNLYELGVYARAKGQIIAALSRRSVRFSAGPIGNVGPCADTQRDATLAQHIPYWFFSQLDQLAAAEIATCLADAIPDRDGLARAFVGSGGTTTLRLSPLPALADGTPVWTATPGWKDSAAVGSWASGQTRWLLVKRQRDGRWAMELATTAPR